MSKPKKIVKQEVYQQRIVLPKTKNQAKCVDSLKKNVVTICMGVAGTGKSHLSVGVAVESMYNGFVDKIIITRPAVEAGEHLGALPGTQAEKMEPYLRPIFDELELYLSPTLLKQYRFSQRIEVVPFAHMRGRNFHKTFIIGDELQNCTYEQIVLLLTRLGRDSIIALNGDPLQSDLPKWQQGGLEKIAKKIEGLDNVGICYLTNEDIIRNPIIGTILERLKEDDN